jgi:hypothetical protein
MNVCTASGLSSLGTSLGLSQTTGYSPYLPLLALTVAAKWFHICQLNPAFGFITSDWFLVVIAFLTAADLIIDLIPGVSTGWHAVHTAITPFLGGIIAAATTSSLTLPSSLSSGTPLPLAFLATPHGLTLTGTTATILMFLVGFVLAGLVHLHRFGGRTVANVGHVFTLGISNIVMSLLEDLFAVVSVILSFLAPLVMLVIVAIVVLVLLFTIRYMRRGLRFLQGNQQSRG